MKKIFIPLIALSVVAVSCKKETEVKDERLETLIKNKDVKGLQQYKDRQKFKLDSLNQVMGQIDAGLNKLGVTDVASGFVQAKKLEISAAALGPFLGGDKKIADMYYSFEIPKRHGGTRRISAPAPRLKKMQRRVYEKLLANAE